MLHPYSTILEFLVLQSI